MTRCTRTAFLLTLAIAAVATAQATQPAGVPVKSVVLYSSGVGYFEHFGTVSGDQQETLQFKTEQINDILKSLVLQDLDGGRISAVTYPSLDPLEKTLKSFQVDLSGNPALSQLLSQLRGAKVTIDAGGSKLSGTILGIEKKQKAAGGDKGAVIETNVLNIVAGSTVRALDMDSVTSIQLDDPQLQQELTKALTAVAAARDQEKKPVTIGFAGQGDRRVRLGYVIETPVWKTSYRLILDEPRKKDASATPSTHPSHEGKLQGWAIVENQTDNDWTNINLSLISGRPISFVQDLYQPLYNPRPVVRNELLVSLMPQLYEDALLRKGLALDAKQNVQDRSRLAQRNLALNSNLQIGAGLQNLAVASPAALGEKDEAAYGREAANFFSSVSSAAASAQQLGELFEYTVPNVSLARQRSAMIPIVTDDIEVERLSIYNQAVLAKNPLYGARLKNTTGKHLLAGPITVLEQSAYAGDARIDNVPPGQQRLISYGIDLQMRINPQNNSQSSQIRAGRIIKGMLEITNKHVSSQEYAIDNRSDRDKTLVVEHPVRPNWNLIDTPEPAEKNEKVYRFRKPVPAGKQEKLVVKEESIDSQTIAILPADLGQMDWYSKQGEISKDVRDALAKAVALKSAMVDVQRKIDETTQRLQRITEEQTRLRENMKTVERTSQYYTRLLNKLNDQETEIEKRQTELDDLKAKLETRRGDLEKYLADLNVA